MTSIDNVTDITPRRQYVAAAAQTAFDYPFPIFVDADLVVDVDGVTKTITTDYTVSGAGADTGGTVTFLSAMAGGEIVTLYRDIVFERTTDYQQNGPLSSSAINDELDRLTLADQQLQERVNRALRIPLTAAVDDDDIELTVANWANKYLTFDTDGKPTPAAISSTTMTQATMGLLLYPVLGIEGATVVAAHYPYGDVRRYGADPSGVSDSTAAWNSALAQRLAGGAKIVFPAGLWKGNFVVTGQNVEIDAEEMFYEDTGTLGFIANNTANPVWQFGDGTTRTTSIRVRGGLMLHGQGTAQKGLLVNGASNIWVDGLITHGFTSYGFNYTASTTQPSAYCFINNYRIDAGAGASAIGLVVTQPANYPTSYATALYFNHGAISANASGLWGVQINARSAIYVENSYWSMRDGKGINFPDASETGTINATNLFIDTLGTANDVLVTSAGSSPLPSVLRGIFSLNGKVSINGVTSAVTLQGAAGYLAYRTFMHYPSVVGALDFQNTSANAADQTAETVQNVMFSRSGNNLFARGDYFQLANAAGTSDGAFQFGITGILVMTGAGAPSATLPKGTLYLRTDASSTTTRLYISLGGGSWAYFTASA